MFVNEIIILLSTLPKVIVATICGALVGIEREKRNKGYNLLHSQTVCNIIMVV